MSKTAFRKLCLSILLIFVAIVMIGCKFNFGGLGGDDNSGNTPSDQGSNTPTPVTPTEEEVDYAKKILEYFYAKMSIAPYTFATWYGNYENNTIKFVKQNGNFAFSDNKTDHIYALVSYNDLVNNPFGIEIMDTGEYVFIKNSQGRWVALFQYETKNETPAPTTSYNITIRDDYSGVVSIVINQEMTLSNLLTANGFKVAPTHDGYTFKHWLVNNQEVTSRDATAFKISENATIVAVWEKNSEIPVTYYNISITANDRNVEFKTQTAMYLATILTNNGFDVNPSKEGFTFKCWLVNETEVSALNAYNYRIDFDATIIANWQLIEEHEELEYETTYSYDAYYHFHRCITPGYENETKDKVLHTYNDWSISKNSSLTEEGIEERTCTVCGYKEIHYLGIIMGSTSAEVDSQISYLVNKLDTDGFTDEYIELYYNFENLYYNLPEDIINGLTKRDVFDSLCYRVHNYTDEWFNIHYNTQGGYLVRGNTIYEKDLVLEQFKTELYNFMVSRNAWANDITPSLEEFLSIEYWDNNFRAFRETLLSKFLYTPKVDDDGYVHLNYRDVIPNATTFLNTEEGNKYLPLFDYLDEAVRYMNMAGQDFWSRYDEPYEPMYWLIQLETYQEGMYRDLTSYNNTPVKGTIKGTMLGAYRFAQYVCGATINVYYRNYIPENIITFTLNRDQTVKEGYQGYNRLSKNVELKYSAYKEGYRFDGWYLDNGSAPVIDPKNPEYIEVYAKWVKIDPNAPADKEFYTVEIKDFYGWNADQYFVDKGDTVTFNLDWYYDYTFVDNGTMYVFLGLSDNQNATTAKYTDNVVTLTVTNNITLYPIYQSSQTVDEITLFEYNDVLGKSVQSIAEAVALINEGGTINVPAGTYNEYLEINKPVTILGVNHDKDYVEGETREETIINGAININANDVTLNGISMMNTSEPISVNYSSNTSIKYCYFYNILNMNLILLYNPTNINISHNAFVQTRSLYGLRFVKCDTDITNFYFENNYINVTYDSNPALAEVVRINGTLFGDFTYANNHAEPFATNNWLFYVRSLAGATVTVTGNTVFGRDEYSDEPGMCLYNSDSNTNILIDGNTFKNVNGSTYGLTTIDIGTPIIISNNVYDNTAFKTNIDLSQGYNITFINNTYGIEPIGDRVGNMPSDYLTTDGYPHINIPQWTIDNFYANRLVEGDSIVDLMNIVISNTTVIDGEDGTSGITADNIDYNGLNPASITTGYWQIIVRVTDNDGNTSESSFEIRVYDSPLTFADLTIDFMDGTVGSRYVSDNWTQERYDNGWTTITGQMNCREKDGYRVVNMVCGYGYTYRYTYNTGRSLGLANELEFRIGNYFSPNLPIQLNIYLIDVDDNIHYINGGENSFTGIPAQNGLMTLSYPFNDVEVKSIVFICKCEDNKTSSSYLYFGDIKLHYNFLNYSGDFDIAVSPSFDKFAYGSEFTVGSKTLTVGTNAFTNINDAINAANPNDVIYVAQGDYYEQIYINKSYINLISNGAVLHERIHISDGITDLIFSGFILNDYAAITTESNYYTTEGIRNIIFDDIQSYNVRSYYVATFNFTVPVSNLSFTNCHCEFISGRGIRFEKPVHNLNMTGCTLTGSPTDTFDVVRSLDLVDGYVEFINNHFENCKQSLVFINHIGQGTYNVFNNVFMGASSSSFDIREIKDPSFEGKAVINIIHNTFDGGINDWGTIRIRNLTLDGANGDLSVAQKVEANINYNKFINIEFTEDDPYYIDMPDNTIGNVWNIDYNYSDKGMPDETWFDGMAKSFDGWFGTPEELDSAYMNVDLIAPTIMVPYYAIDTLYSYNFVEGQDITEVLNAFYGNISINDNIDGDMLMSSATINYNRLNPEEVAIGEWEIIIIATDNAGNSSSWSFTINVYPNDEVKLANVTLDFMDGTVGTQYVSDDWKQEKYTDEWIDVTGQMNCREKNGVIVVNMVSGYSMTYRYTYNSKGLSLGYANKMTFKLGNYFSPLQDIQFKLILVDVNNVRKFLYGSNDSWYTVPAGDDLVDYSAEFEAVNVKSVIFVCKSNANSNVYLYLGDVHLFFDGNLIDLQLGKYDYSIDEDNKTITILSAKNKNDLTSAIFEDSYTINNEEYVITTISNFALANCSNLEEVRLPNTLVRLDDFAINNCYRLTEIVLPASLKYIGDYTFASCNNLSSLTIPNGVETIGGWVFSGSQITSIYFPASVTYIGDCLFSHCRNLESIVVDPNNPNYDSRDNCNAIIETATNRLSSSCNATVIPSSVKCIGFSAFYDNDVAEISIPEGVEVIEEGAFRYMPLVSNFVIPSTVNHIGLANFVECERLVSLSVSEGNQTYDSRDNCNAIIETATDKLICGTDISFIPDTVKIIGKNAFEGRTRLTSITLPEGLTTIEDFAFTNDDGLTSINIPSTVESIGINSFIYCGNLESITVNPNNEKYDSRNDCNAIIETATNTLLVGCQNTVIPDDVKVIGTHAFWGCSNLKTITLGSSVETLMHASFMDCSRLVSIVIPATVTKIYNQAFDMCRNLSNVYFMGNEEEWNAIEIGETNDCLTNATIHYNWPSQPTEEFILEYAFTLDPGESLGIQGSITGTIIRIDTEYSEQYNNITVTIKPDVATDDDHNIQCFRLAEGADLTIGDHIRVTGNIQNYKGTIEFVAKSTYVKIIDGE